jgi:antitoxin component YwqK of YwqJK toxin-antitoxin module
MSQLRKISISLLAILCACHAGKHKDDLVLIQIQDRNGLSETISNPDRLVTYSCTDFLSPQPFKKVLRVFRKEGQNRSIITTYYPNGSTWQMLEAREMRAFGAYREWHSNGTKKIEATVIGGNADLAPGAQDSWLFDDTSLVWNENGQLLASIQYDKGALSGTSTYYYPSGATEKTVPYIRGRIEGQLNEFWETGAIKAAFSFADGCKDGLGTSYWPNGSPCCEEEYEQGLLKTGCYWDPAHQLTAQVSNQTGFRALFDSNRLVQLFEIRKGIAEGLVQNFGVSGDLVSTYYLKNGKKQGEEIEFYPRSDTANEASATPKISVTWDQDMIHGIAKTWYPDGKIESQRELVRNKRCGVCCAWYRDGSLMLTEEYDNDELINGKYFRKNQLDPVSSICSGNGTATIFDGEGSFIRKISYQNHKPIDLD